MSHYNNTLKQLEPLSNRGTLHCIPMVPTYQFDVVNHFSSQQLTCTYIISGGLQGLRDLGVLYTHPGDPTSIPACNHTSLQDGVT